MHWGAVCPQALDALREPTSASANVAASFMVHLRIEMVGETAGRSARRETEPDVALFA